MAAAAQIPVRLPGTFFRIQKTEATEDGMNSNRDGNFWRWRDASLSRNRQRRLHAVLVGLALLVRALPAAAAIPQAERDALIAIYTSAGGDAWMQNA